MKIRSAVILLGIFGLLAGSLYGNSHTLAKQGILTNTGQSSGIIGQSIPSSTGSATFSATQESSSNDFSASSTPSVSSTAIPPSPSAQPSTASSSTEENPSILTQVQNTNHYKLSIQTEGTSCQACHLKNSYKLRNTGWQSCGSCHINSSGNPTPGNEVNHPQFQMIQGVAIYDILPMPSYKYKYQKDTFSCIDCHITNESKHDFMVPGVTVTQDPKGIRPYTTEIDYQAFRSVFNQEKCAVCHPSSADMVNRVKNEQEIISNRLAKLEPIYEEWSKKVASLKPEDPNVQAFKNGATYYTFVNADGSKGVHNFPYAQTLLDKAEIYWKALKQ